MQLSLSLLFFLAVGCLGYFLAMSQFCMVRAVLSLKEGDLSPIRCLLAISLSIGLFVFLINHFTDNFIYNFTSASPKVALCGLLFGMAVHFNEGCYIGTLNYLGRGQLSRFFCVIGWIVGFALFSRDQSETSEYSEYQVLLTLLGVSVFLLIAEIWSLKRKQEFIPNEQLPHIKGLKASALMLSIGLIIGFLIFVKLPYHPSTMSLNLGLWLKGEKFNYLSLSAIMMPIGMMIFHQMRNKFAVIPIELKDLKHLLCGIVMAITTTLGDGGNDGYLFEFLPKGSLHAVIGLLGMTVGILLTDTLCNQIIEIRKSSQRTDLK